MRYKFKLEEHLQRYFVIEAPSEAAAYQYLEDRWSRDQYIMSIEDDMDDYNIEFVEMTDGQCATLPFLCSFYD